MAGGVWEGPTREFLDANEEAVEVAALPVGGQKIVGGGAGVAALVTRIAVLMLDLVGVQGCEQEEEKKPDAGIVSVGPSDPELVYGTCTDAFSMFGIACNGRRGRLRHLRVIGCRRSPAWRRPAWRDPGGAFRVTVWVMSKKELVEGGGETLIEGARDLAGALTPAARDAVGGALDYFAPGVKFLSAAWETYHRRRADKFMRQLSALLEHDEGEMAAQKLRERIGEETFNERVVQGFRFILESWCEAAHECITLLVADHLRGLYTPRDYQLAGRLLAESDPAMLSDLDDITQRYVDVLDQALPDTLRHRAIGEYSPAPGQRVIWVAAIDVAGSNRSVAASRGADVGFGFDTTVNALLRHHFGYPPDSSTFKNSKVPGYGQHNYGEANVLGSALMFFDRVAHDQRMRALYRYLQPVRNL